MRDSLLELVKEKDEFEVITANKGGEVATGITTKGPKKGAKPVVWLADVAAQAEHAGVSAEEAYAEIRRSLSHEGEEIDMESILAEIEKEPAKRLLVRLVRPDLAPDFNGYIVKRGPFALTFISELTVAGNEGTFVVPDATIEQILENEKLTADELANLALKNCEPQFIGMVGGLAFPRNVSLRDISEGRGKIFSVTNKDMHHGAVGVLSPQVLSIARLLEEDLYIFLESSDMAFVATQNALGDDTLGKFAAAMRHGRAEAGPVQTGHFISDDIYRLDSLTGEITVAA